jgi:hypothetical protein
MAEISPRVKMSFKELVNFIRSQDCKVTLYNTKILKQTESMGCFNSYPAPEICMATIGYTQLELVKTILHEYAHFLQWEDGFLELIGDDETTGWGVFNSWIGGKEFSKKDLNKAEKAISIIEYDAEIRTIELSEDLGIDIGDYDDYIRDAYGYLCTIKWTINREIAR